ncbi:hypothetical protein ACFRMO_07930 [Streptomyces anulatus]|uniref:hypothetical protein n=1 Tax=Streptomyces anulatus TaxID=1892 RepID=UPI0036AB54EF
MTAIKPLKSTGATPAKGKWYTLLTDFGEGVGMLARKRRYRAGDQQTAEEEDRQLLVLDILEPATYGVGYSSEKTVLCMWLEASAPGRLSQHHISFPLTQFVELVGQGKEPPEWADWQAQQSPVGDA